MFLGLPETGRTGGDSALCHCHASDLSGFRKSANIKRNHELFEFGILTPSVSRSVCSTTSACSTVTGCSKNRQICLLHPRDTLSQHGWDSFMPVLTSFRHSGAFLDFKVSSHAYKCRNELKKKNHFLE